jgi:hypothetical protein
MLLLSQVTHHIKCGGPQVTDKRHRSSRVRRQRRTIKLGQNPIGRSPVAKCEPGRVAHIQRGVVEWLHGQGQVLLLHA